MTGAIACFGEAVLRLGTPRGELLLAAPRLEAHLGGAEVNVAAALAALGHPARLVSVLPDGSVGDAALAVLRGYGLDLSACRRGPGRMGLYYLEPETPCTSAQVTYDREGSAFARMQAEEWDWARALNGCDWLHLSGVTPALNEQCAAAALAAARHARGAGLKVSFDGNWRGRLWQQWPSDPPAILAGIVEQACVLFGNHKDAAVLLQREFDGHGVERRRAAAVALFDRFPGLELIASTARTVVTPDHHAIAGRIDTRDQVYQCDPVAIRPVIDRIGGGDAFAAGVIDGLRRSVPCEEALRTGLALAGIKHGLAGDCARVSRAMLDAARFDPGDVER